jgi:hypothetical protein
MYLQGEFFARRYGYTLASEPGRITTGIIFAGIAEVLYAFSIYVKIYTSIVVAEITFQDLNSKVVAASTVNCHFDIAASCRTPTILIQFIIAQSWS